MTANLENRGKKLPRASRSFVVLRALCSSGYYCHYFCCYCCYCFCCCYAAAEDDDDDDDDVVIIPNKHLFIFLIFISNIIKIGKMNV